MPPRDGDSPEEWRRRARAFAEDRLRPLAESVDREDRLPAELLAWLRQERFLGLGVPERWGGAGGSTRAIVAVLEELAAESAAAATLLSVHLSVAAAPILQWGTDDQREEYLRPLAEGRWLGAFGLTEPSVGSDTARLATRYERDGTGYRLTGSKMFITNGASADLLLVFATRDAALGSKGISSFLLRKGTEGFSIAQRLEKLGLRGSETNELVLERAQVPDRGLLGPESQGLRVALGALTGGRVGIAACALGVARAAFEEMQRHAKRSADDRTKALVAQSFVDLAAGRALVAEAARLKDAGEEYVTSASAAKLHCARAAVRIASRGIDVAGWAGVRAGAAPERLLRDARVFPIVEGSTEIQELILGRELVGR